MANNDLIYNAALAGAVNAILWPEEPTSFEYLRRREVALTFATTVDAGIPVDPAMNPSKAQLLASVVAGILRSNEVTVAAALASVALYESVVGFLLPVPTPPVPFVETALDYDASAPLGLTIIPPSAPTGLYSVAMSVVVEQAAAGGAIDSILSFNSPAAIPVSLNFPWNNITVANGLARFSSWLVPFINGTPATISTIPTGVTGSPLFDIYCTAERLASI